LQHSFHDAWGSHFWHLNLELFVSQPTLVLKTVPRRKTLQQTLTDAVDVTT
jgi:hypothetical protein